MKGSVKFYNVMKRFGFIAGDDGKEYFVHQSGINENVKLNEGDQVTFEPEDGDRGLKAINVSKGDSREDSSEQNSEEVYEESDEESEITDEESKENDKISEENDKESKGIDEESEKLDENSEGTDETSEENTNKQNSDE